MTIDHHNGDLLSIDFSPLFEFSSGWLMIGGMRNGILNVVIAFIVLVFSVDTALAGEIVVSNGTFIVSVDSSALPKWQQDEIGLYEISARVVFRKEMEELDSLLYSNEEPVSSDQEKDIYVVIGIRKKPSPSQRILVLEGEFQQPERLKGVKFTFHNVGVWKEERDLVVRKLLSHDARATVCASCEWREEGCEDNPLRDQMRGIGEVTEGSGLHIRFR